MVCFRLSSCCFFFSVDFGSRLIAFIGVLLGVVGLAWNAARNQLIESLLMLIGVVMSGTLLFGVVNRCRPAVLIWLGWVLGELILLPTSSLALAFLTFEKTKSSQFHRFITFVISVLGISIVYFYMWLVVLSFHRQLREQQLGQKTEANDERLGLGEGQDRPTSVYPFGLVSCHEENQNASTSVMIDDEVFTK